MKLRAVVLAAALATCYQYTTIFSPKLSNPNSTMMSAIDTMNEMGREGWRVISVIYDDGGYGWYRITYGRPYVCATPTPTSKRKK